MSREAISEQSSVREGASYNEVSKQVMSPRKAVPGRQRERR